MSIHEEVEKHLNRWQDILRLRDWDIKIRIVETEWRKSGDIKIDLEDKKAVLLVNNAPTCENLEELVIHELLHVKLYGMDQMIEDLLCAVFGKKEDPKREFAHTQFMVLLESTVEDLTKGYLAAVKSETPLSFGRLQEAVDQECNNTDFQRLIENDFDEDCVFCQQLRSGEKILENDYAFAVLDSYPVTRGHTLIITKRHCADFFESTRKEQNAIHDLLNKRRKQLLEDPSLEGFNIGVNSGEAAGQTIFHLHVHLIPRRKGDTDDPRGGVRGVIPGKMRC